MNPTEAVRKGLDELGIEWWPDKYYKETNTVWRVNGFEWRASEQKDGKLLIGCTSLEHLTPAQAIAATCGAKKTTRNGKHKKKYGRQVPLCECCGYAIGDMRYNFCPKCGAEIVGDWE